MSNYCPQTFGRPNQRSLAIYLVGSQQTYFQLRAAFLSLAPSSAKGYYATGGIASHAGALYKPIPLPLLLRQLLNPGLYSRIYGS